MSRVHPSLRQIMALLLIAAALLLRAGVPAGWMAGADASGQISITMCNSGQTLAIPMKPGHQPAETDDAATMDGKACAFASNHAAGLPPEGLAPLPLPQLAAAD